MDPERRNVLLLASAQALALAANSTVFTISVLAGQALAPAPSLATLPMTSVVVGAALVTLPASLLMKRLGRRAGFLLGAIAGLVGAGFGAAALQRGSFVCLCLGMLLYGIYSGSAQYYRLAAAEMVRTDARGPAIARVLAGGIVGGLVGPEVSKWTVDMLAVRYVGGYLAVMAFLAVAAVVVAGLRTPVLAAGGPLGAARPLRVVAAQPTFVVAVLGSSVGYGVMTLLMMATPLAMSSCGHGFSSTAFVIQWHVVAMFAPSFLTGDLVRRFGAPKVMLMGALLEASCAAVALGGVDVAHFWAALVLLGVGWNFLYVGGTALLTECYTSAERAHAQGLNELLIASTQIVASVGSAGLIARGGWAGPNQAALAAVALAAAAILWSMLRSRPPAFEPA
jgi:MFS family permease